MRITSLSKVIFNMVKSGEPKAGEVVRIANGLCQKSARHREVLSAEMLPKAIRTKLQEFGISNPTVMTGYNSHKGSVVAGVTIKDGKRTVGHAAVGFDKTKGDAPILQIRGKVLNENKEEMAKLQYSMNPNAPLENVDNAATSMSKRNGNINVHSEIGNNHYYDLTINPQRIEASSMGRAIPKGACSEKELKDMYKDLQADDFPWQVQRVDKKFTELFSEKPVTAKAAAAAQETPVSPITAKELQTLSGDTVDFTSKLLKTPKGKTLESCKVVDCGVFKKAGGLTKLKKTLAKSAKTGKPKLGAPAARTSTHYGKHKVKRYLYHMTSEENYKKMLETGKITTTSDMQLDYQGVFMTELENLAKKWRNSKEWDFIPENKDGMFLSLALLKQTSKDSGKIVCLRIPTKNLDHDMLKIRSQNKLGLAEKDSSSRIKEHITKGAPAKDANLYKQRKEAIEYIYQDDIPMDNVELVGMTEIPEITMDNLAVWSKAEQRNVVLDALKKLFQGQPEAKGIDAMV